jgi:hypothetical protein
VKNCYLLTVDELSAKISAGYTLNSGPYDTATACDADCNTDLVTIVCGESTADYPATIFLTMSDMTDFGAGCSATWPTSAVLVWNGSTCWDSGCVEVAPDCFQRFQLFPCAADDILKFEYTDFQMTLDAAYPAVPFFLTHTIGAFGNVGDCGAVTSCCDFTGMTLTFSE